MNKRLFVTLSMAGLAMVAFGAKIGKKIDLMRKNKNVSFEMDCEHNIILYDERMSCTMGYESVIV